MVAALRSLWISRRAERGTQVSAGEHCALKGRRDHCSLAKSDIRLLLSGNYLCQT